MAPDEITEEAIIRIQDPMGIELPATVVRISGASPLLMNNPLAMLAGGGAKKTIPTPEDEARVKAYRDGDGSLALPTAISPLGVEGMGSFWIGYYHQRAELR